MKGNMSIDRIRLRFKPSKIKHWSDRYAYFQDESEIEDGIAHAVKKRSHLTKDEFLRICYWKTPRTQSKCRSNAESMIHEVTGLALSTKEEQLRIEVLTLLKGVSWPTASVILHFCHADPYPILDFRALWSCKVEEPNQYSFPFWCRYVEFCRQTAKEAGVSMRVLDRALWQYSKERQP